MYKKYE